MQGNQPKDNSLPNSYHLRALLNDEGLRAKDLQN
jgi:hypothetical protein